MTKNHFVLDLIGVKNIPITKPFVIGERLEGSHNRVRRLVGVGNPINYIYFDNFEKEFGNYFLGKKEEPQSSEEKIWYAETVRQTNMYEAIIELSCCDYSSAVQMSQIFSLLKEYNNKDIKNKTLWHTNFFFMRDIMNDVRIIMISRATGNKWEGYGWFFSSYPIDDSRHIFLDKGYRIFFI